MDDTCACCRIRSAIGKVFRRPVCQACYDHLSGGHTPCPADEPGARAYESESAKKTRWS